MKRLTELVSKLPGIKGVVIINIEEIAKLAGVSKTTVSRVLNNKPEVSLETREKVLKVIDKHNYQPNIFAKAISQKESRILALLIPYEADYIFSNSFYEEVLRGVSTEVNNNGYYLLLCYTIDNSFENLVRQKLVDGFILISPSGTDKYIMNMLKMNEIPFVTTSQVPGEEDYVYVDIDNFYGASLAVEHLVSLGHRKIGLILNGPESLASSQKRLEGYRSILEKYKIPYQDNLVRIGNTSLKSGYQKMLSLMESELTAVFVANDMMAVGTIQAIKDNHKRIPDDISVVGFDDIPLTRIIDPPLTTVRQPAFEKGVVATKLLLSFIKDKEKPVSEKLDVELIIRKSTGKLK